MDTTSEQAQRPRIAIVDDSAVIRKAMGKVLGKEFELVEAENGEQAWRKIQQDTSIQLVLTDLMMPELDGFGLMKRIKASDDRGIREMPVIVITGANDTNRLKLKALDLGASDFITKPFTAVDLLARTKAHADYQRLTNELRNKMFVDELTGVLNRKGFEQQLEKDISMAARHQQDLAIFQVRLNAANELLSRFGRSGVDHIIRLLAKVLSKALRKEDTLARDSNVTFSMSLPMARPENSENLAQRICKVVSSRQIKMRDEEITLSVSIGICTIDPGLRPATAEVMKKANKAMDAAIAEGFGKVACQSIQDEVDEDKIEALSIDNILQHIQQGGGEDVKNHMHKVLQQLGPIFALLTDEQRKEIMNGTYNRVTIDT